MGTDQRQYEISRSMDNIFMAKRTPRLQVPDLGEPYNDRLTVEAFLKDNTKTQEAASLLRSKLMEREAFRSKLVQELANKRGISYEEMWSQILTGKAKKMTSEESAGLEQLQPNSDEE